MAPKRPRAMVSFLCAILTKWTKSDFVAKNKKFKSKKDKIVGIAVSFHF